MSQLCGFMWNFPSPVFILYFLLDVLQGILGDISF